MKRLLFIALLLAPIAAIAGEQVTVKLDNTPLLTTPASGATTITTLSRGR